MAITSEQQNSIKENCSSIKETLVSLQHTDARHRLNVGRYYEIILNKFIVPLNLRLVDNNTTNAELVANQSNFSETRAKFNNDYIIYQQNLEELVAINCEEEPVKFYEKLETTREKRKAVRQDMAKLKTLADKQMSLVSGLKEKTE